MKKPYLAHDYSSSDNLPDNSHEYRGHGVTAKWVESAVYRAGRRLRSTNRAHQDRLARFESNVGRIQQQSQDKFKSKPARGRQFAEKADTAKRAARRVSASGPHDRWLLSRGKGTKKGGMR